MPGPRRFVSRGGPAPGPVQRPSHDPSPGPGAEPRPVPRGGATAGTPGRSHGRYHGAEPRPVPRGGATAGTPGRSHGRYPGAADVQGGISLYAWAEYLGRALARFRARAPREDGFWPRIDQSAPEDRNSGPESARPTASRRDPGLHRWKFRARQRRAFHNTPRMRTRKKRRSPSLLVLRSGRSPSLLVRTRRVGPTGDAVLVSAVGSPAPDHVGRSNLRECIRFGSASSRHRPGAAMPGQPSRAGWRHSVTTSW